MIVELMTLSTGGGTALVAIMNLSQRPLRPQPRSTRTDFYLSAFVALFGCALTLAFLPDTTGLSLDETDRLVRAGWAGAPVRRVRQLHLAQSAEISLCHWRPTPFPTCPHTPPAQPPTAQVPPCPPF